MGISKNNLPYVDFFKNEIKTLGYLQGDSKICTSFHDLSSKSQIFYHQYKGKENKVGFKFYCDLELIIERELRMVVIEVDVEPGFSITSYVLSICNKEGDSHKLMRKFHFDFVPQMTLENKMPIYHLQYGGKVTPRLKDLEVNDEHIIPWLSSPRINSTPINLALLLDLVFCEFPSEITNGVTERREWRDFIKNNEDLVLRSYYERINAFFRGEHKNHFLFRDFYYGKK